MKPWATMSPFRWEFKSKHFDSVLLFKMGKFYEMFEMDAHTGAEVLGLIYMKAILLTCTKALLSFNSSLSVNHRAKFLFFPFFFHQTGKNCTSY